MYRSLFLNTLISGAAYLIVSVVGLVVVPLVVSEYGLTQFGIIALARLFLPTGLLAAFDLGFSENATQAIARARGDGQWPQAWRQTAQLVVIAAVVSIPIAVAVSLLSGHLADLFDVGAGNRASFVELLNVTAICLPLLFTSLVFEGVVRGFEAYRALRSVEVVASLIYGLLAFAAVSIKLTYIWVAYGFLVSVVVRALLSFWICRECAIEAGVNRAADWFKGSWDEVARRCKLMGISRVLGIAQVQVPPLLIGIILGPMATGLYDVLVRLPRFAKSIFGLLNSALLPVATRIETLDDAARSMQRLGHVGLLIVASVALPPLCASAVFAEPILRLWIGPGLSENWPWLAAFFVVPALNTLISFGSTALMARPHAIVNFNRLVAVQIAIQFATAFLFIGLFEERAFILGQVIGALATFVPQMRLIWNEQRLGTRTRTLLISIVTVGVLLAISAFALGIPWRLHSAVSLAVVLSAWTLLYWILLLTISSPEQRALVYRLVPGSWSRW